MQCSNCGHDITPGAEFCGNCGARLVAETAAPGTPATTQSPIITGQPQPAQAPMPTAVVVGAQPGTGTAPGQQAYAVVKQSSKGLSIASMVLGILSIFGLLFYYLAGIIFGVIAIVLAIIGKKKGGRGMAIAGLVTGIIGAVLSVLLLLLFIVAVASCKDSSSDSCKRINSKVSSQALINVTPPLFNQE